MSFCLSLKARKACNSSCLNSHCISKTGWDYLDVEQSGKQASLHSLIIPKSRTQIANTISHNHVHKA